MKLHINGEARSFAEPVPPAEFTLAFLVESLNLKSDRVAVELNREIAPRDRWLQTLLKDGDRLEIVHFVGGGACCQAFDDSRVSDATVSHRFGYAQSTPSTLLVTPRRANLR
jgi:sulfur carrier protein